MRTRHTILTLFTTFTITSLLTTTPAAAEFHSIRQSPRYPGSPREAAEAFLADHAGAYRLHDVELAYRTTLHVGDYRTVRFAQTYEGLPVLGTAAAVRVAPDGRVTVAAFGVARELLVSTVPRITFAQVRTLLASAVGPWAANGRLTFTLAVLPEAAGPGHLVWQVDVPNGQGGLRYLIDAHRGVVLHWRPLAIHAQGRVYPISRVNTPNTTDVELVDLDDASPLVLTGWSGQFVVTNYASGGGWQTELVAVQTLHPNAGDDFLYDPPAQSSDASDGFAQVGVYHHLTRMRDYFVSTHGVDFTPASWGLAAVANSMEDGQPMDNAYFSEQGLGAPWNKPNMIGIGQGTFFDFADDSDVFLHEFTHYVSHNAVGYNMGGFAANEWGRSPFSGAVDEGLCDYFASTVNDNAVLGETSLAPFGMARDLTDTSKVCPDDMNSESHDDGEIIGSLAWTVRTAFGQTLGDQLVWGAMTLLLPYATFGDFGQGLIQTANDLVGTGQLNAADVQTIQTAMDARGVTDCFNELPVSVDHPQISFLRGFDYYAAMFGSTCQNIRDMGRQTQSLFHFRVTPNADDTSIRLIVHLSASPGADVLWGIYGRQGQHVTFTTEGMGADISEYDYEFTGVTDNDAELLINQNSTPPFDPTQTYHFVLLHQNCPDTRANVSVAHFSDPPTPDAGVTADASTSADASDNTPDNPKQGCECRTPAGGPGSTLPILLLVLGFLFYRRRPR